MRLVRTAELETVRTTPRKLPERLPFPNKPGEPDWGKIGWEHFENLDVNKVIWERWAPPMRNRYLSLRYLEELGTKEFFYDVDQLGIMTDEELVRLDDEIKKMSYTLENKQADEMEKERELQVLLRGASGALKIGGGVLAVVGAVGAVFAVVATGGLAAPIIVGTAGALTTTFAASDVVEGVGDVKAAVTKEGLDKRSYNPIRDDVFGGNELAYALTGTGISLVTDIVTGAVIAKIPERISASMAAKSAKRAAKKAAQDAAKAVRAAEKAEKAAETVEKTEEAAKAVSAAERFYSELDALKLKAQEIPHTLTAEEVRACEAVKLQMKGELSTAGKVSVEEIEKIDEAVKAASAIDDVGLGKVGSRL